jgi:DNA-binding NarL/FixJ family response regulator
LLPLSASLLTSVSLTRCAMSDVRQDLPEAYQTLIETFGEDVTARLIAMLGGVRIWVPAKPGPRHQLTQALGQELAEEIARKMGAGPLTVPDGQAFRLAAQRHEIRRLTAEGVPAQQIARRLKVNERTVFRVRAMTKGTKP